MEAARLARGVKETREPAPASVVPVLVGCGAPRPAHARRSRMQLLPWAVLLATALPQPSPRSSARVLPFELHQGSIWLAVKVNGSPPLRFELDSGSSVDVID